MNNDQLDFYIYLLHRRVRHPHHGDLTGLIVKGVLVLRGLCNYLGY